MNPVKISGTGVKNPDRFQIRLYRADLNGAPGTYLNAV